MSEMINQRVRLSKTLLKSSLIKLLETQELQKVSIKELCERAGINRSTFYRYYGSQYDLLHEIETDTVRDIIGILESHPAEKSDALLEICRYLEQNIFYVKPLLSNSSEFIKTILSHPTIRREIYRAIEPHYEAAQLDYVFDFIAFGSARIIQIWASKEDRESSAEVAALLARLMRLA